MATIWDGDHGGAMTHLYSGIEKWPRREEREAARGQGGRRDEGR